MSFETHYQTHTFTSCNFLHCKSPFKQYNHPTSKPEQLMKWLLLHYSDKNNLILDPFLGSDTTAVACKELGRKYIGIEISPEYCEIAKKRLANTMESLF